MHFTTASSATLVLALQLWSSSAVPIAAVTAADLYNPKPPAEYTWKSVLGLDKRAPLPPIENTLGSGRVRLPVKFLSDDEKEIPLEPLNMGATLNERESSWASALGLVPPEPTSWETTLGLDKRSPFTPLTPDEESELNNPARIPHPLGVAQPPKPMNPGGWLSELLPGYVHPIRAEPGRASALGLTPPEQPSWKTTLGLERRRALVGIINEFLPGGAFHRVRAGPLHALPRRNDVGTADDEAVQALIQALQQA